MLESYTDDSAQSDAESRSIVVEFVFLYREFLRQYVLALITAFGARLMVEGDVFTKAFAKITEELQAVADIFEGVPSRADVIRLRWAAIEQLRTRLRNSDRRSFLFDSRLGSLIGNG